MSAASFWQAIDPRALATREARISGPLRLARLPRLAAQTQVPLADSEVQAELAFWRDPGGLVVISGQIRGSLPVMCQRCLEPAEIVVDSAFRLALQASQQGAVAPEGTELLEHPGDVMVPAELVEDELLLSLPLVPVHADQAECGPLASKIGGRRDSHSGRRPFEILKNLKTD